MKFEYTKQFTKNYNKAVKGGFSKKIDELLHIVKNNPFEDYPPFKKLYGGQYSRRINDQHRLVYDVYEDKVVFLRCWGHYDD